MSDYLWSIVYDRAVRKDGSLLFPERLSKAFLEQARKTMGSYLYANQYLNEIIPDDEKRFRPEWLREYKELPKSAYRFAFIDPAIGQHKHHDYTAVVVVEVDSDGVWYLVTANRYRITPTEIIEKIFEINEQFKPQAIGIEIVAYQEALLYFLDQECKRRQKTVPIKGIARKGIAKEVRILGLVPRFEWGRIYVKQGLTDFEDEYSKFPRGQYDDIMDALSSLEELVYYPQKTVAKIEKPNSPSDPDYERWYRQELSRRSQQDDGPIDTY